MSNARLIQELKVPVENVVSSIRRMRVDGWRLDTKTKPAWDDLVLADRVTMTFSREP